MAPDLNAWIDLEFPLRVAAIDIGSNGIRFIAAEFSSLSVREELRYQRVPVRLGRSTFQTGRLTQEGIDGAVRALIGFRRHLDTFGIDHYRAVATSAVRESDNGAEFVDRAWQEAGIAIETVTEGEEARLVWQAVSDRFPLQGRWMLVDLGGGSVEVSVVDERGIEWSESHTMGSVRLLERLGGTEASSEADLGRLIEEYVGALRLGDGVLGDLEGLIATGGNIEILAALADSPPDGNGVSRLPAPLLARQNDRLARYSYRERVETLGLREDRADVIIPAGRVYQRIAELAGADVIVVPHVGVKEGILLDLVEELSRHHIHTDRQEREISAAAIRFGRRHRFDEPHAIQVARLAMSLFAQLRPVHGLDDRERRILLGAALLHDIGQSVSHRKHHKHSLYLILHGGLAGYSTDEIPLVALTARYHRGAEPSPDHELWGELPPDDRQVVRSLASILRIADALDRDHLQHITAVRVQVESDAVVLDLTSDAPLLSEAWAVNRKSGLFSETFGKEVRRAGPRGFNRES